MTVQFLVPEPRALAAGTPLARLTRAPEHSVVGFVDNAKPKAGALLDAAGTALVRRGVFREHFVWKKPAPSRPITDEERARLLARAHVIVTGVGD